MAALSVLHNIGSFVGTDAVFRVVKTNADLTTIGATQLEIIGGEITDLTGWAAIFASTQILVSVSFDSAAGELTMTMNQAPIGEVHFIIPPFLPQLMSINGIVCAGGIFQHNYP